MRITLYYAEGANCCERIRWALDYKKIAYALVDIDRQHDEILFRSISPFGRVPAMEVDGTPLTESMAMLELLEETTPSRPLNYTTPLLRAQVREVSEAVNSSIHPVQNSSVMRYFQPGWTKDDMRPVRANWIAKNLAKLQARLWLGSNFAVGERFTFADILVAVIFNKGIALGIDPGTLSRFEEHWAHLMRDDEIRLSCPLPRAHALCVSRDTYMSVGTDPQPQEAVPPQSVVVRSSPM